MALLGAGTDYGLFKQDYSGFVNAANTNANAMAGLGKTIANTATDYFKDQNEKKKLLKQSSTQIDAAIKLYPELQGAFAPILDNLRDENISLNDRFASASATPGLIELAIGQSNKNRDFGFKERELTAQENRYKRQDTAEQNRYIESQKPDASKWTNYNEVINIGGRAIKVVGQTDQYGAFKDLNGNQYPNVGMAFSDTQPTTEQNNGMVLPDKNVPTPPSSVDYNAVPSISGDVSIPQPVVSPDMANENIVSNEIIMPAGSSYVAQEKFRPFNAEESKLYGSQGQVDTSTNRAYPITPPSGTSFKTNPDGSVEYISGVGVSQKTEKATEARKQQQGSFVNEFIKTASETLKMIPNLPDSPIGAKLGSILGNVLPGTETGRVVSRLGTLKANLALDKINQLREASPTGGSAGNMTEKEWPLFMQEFGSLDVAENKQDLEARLKNASVKLFNRVNGTPEQRAAALKNGTITSENNKIVEDQYNQMLSNLNIATPTAPATSQPPLFSPETEATIQKHLQPR